MDQGIRQFMHQLPSPPGVSRVSFHQWINDDLPPGRVHSAVCDGNHELAELLGDIRNGATS